MPIKRLQKQGPPQFPCIGKLRKGGEKRKNAKGEDIFGTDLEYFRFTSEDEHALAMFEASYGTTPDTIEVFLPFPTTDENFEAWQEHWLSGGLQHRCDGETCSIWWDKQAGEYRRTPKPCPGGCKEIGRLMVIIPELQRLAYVTVETHSVNDIMTLTENLNAFESMTGSLQGIPFLLKRRPREISTPNPSGKSGRTRRVKSLLSIEVVPEWAAQKMISMRANSLDAQSIVDNARLLTDLDDITLDSITDAEAEHIGSGSQPEPQGDEFYEDKDSTFVMHPGGVTPVKEFVATHADTPADDDAATSAAPTDEEAGIIGEWAGLQPPAIQVWMVDNGLATSGNSAGTAWMNAVKANGGYSKKNAEAVKLAYLRERRAKHGDKVTA